MKLYVNGVKVPVVDKIDIVLETDLAGETLPRGIRIEFCGGQLLILESDRPPLEIFGERQTKFESTTEPACTIHWGETMNPGTFQGAEPMKVHPPSIPGDDHTLHFEASGPARFVGELHVPADRTDEKTSVKGWRYLPPML